MISIRTDSLWTSIWIFWRAIQCNVLFRKSEMAVKKQFAECSIKKFIISKCGYESSVCRFYGGVILGKSLNSESITLFVR